MAVQKAGQVTWKSSFGRLPLVLRSTASYDASSFTIGRYSCRTVQRQGLKGKTQKGRLSTCSRRGRHSDPLSSRPRATTPCFSRGL